MTLEFQDKVVVITGAGSGIGAATALQFAKNGANLSLNDLNEEGLTATIQDCQNAAPTIKISKTLGSLCNEACLRRFVDDTINFFGKIDILVNCAGICLSDSILNYNMETFDRQIDINIKAVYHLTALCTPHIIQTQGCIVNMSSAAPKVVSLNELSYTISKAAVDYFTKHVAAELGPFGVRVNSLSPGVVLTNLHGKPRDIEIQQEKQPETIEISDEDPRAFQSTFPAEVLGKWA